MRKKRIVTLLAVAIGCVFAAGLGFAQAGASNSKCNSVVLAFSLHGGEKYEKRIGNLTLVMRPLENNWGWYVELQDSAGSDYIYPVTPPLRVGLRQLLGTGYGENARRALSHDRVMRFLLSRSDYDHFRPFLENALWPYNAPNPDRATEEYLQELARIRTGEVRVKVLQADFDGDDVVRSATFRIELIAPHDFRFDPALKPKRAACPPPSQK